MRILPGKNTWKKHLEKTLGKNTWKKHLGQTLGKNLREKLKEKRKEKYGSGGETRTPDTRIMIKLL